MTRAHGWEGAAGGELPDFGAAPEAQSALEPAGPQPQPSSGGEFQETPVLRRNAAMDHGGISAHVSEPGLAMVKVGDLSQEE